MDLLLNFICSAEAAKIDISSVVVFVGDIKYVSLVENMGAKAVYHPALGEPTARIFVQCCAVMCGSLMHIALLYALSTCLHSVLLCVHFSCAEKHKVILLLIHAMFNFSVL